MAEPQTDFVPLAPIRESRFIKEFALEEDVSLGGPAGKQFESIFDSASSVLDLLKEKNKDFIDRQRAKLGKYLTDIPESDIEETFREGFNISLKQQYRLFKKVSPAELGKLNDTEYLEDAASAYAFDFVYTLRMAERLGISPSTALEVARLSYRHNPDTLLQLTKQFPDFSPGIIALAAIGYTNPEGFLTKAQLAIPILQAKFPDFELSVISYAAIHNPTNPEGFLTKVQQTIPILQAKFPEFEPSLIARAAINNPTDPEGFLTKVQACIPELQKQFPDFSPGIIARAAFHNPTNPEGFLKNVQARIPELQKQFPDFSPGIIALAAISNPTNPEGFLTKVQQTIPILQAKFPDFSPGDITHAAIHNPTDTEEFLVIVQARIPELQRRYPEASLSLIRNTLIRNPHKTEEIIAEYLNGK